MCPSCGATLIVELTEAEAEQIGVARQEPPAASPPPWPPLATDAPAPPPPPVPPSAWGSPVLPATPPPAPEPTLVYAGFWRRWLAAFLDEIVLFALAVPFFVLWILPHYSLSAQQIETMSTEKQMEVVGAYLLYALVSMLVQFLYFGLMESSKRRATLGRMAVGIQVVDTHGQRITLSRAFGRRLARILTNFTLAIGYVMQVFTRRRQALHDKIAGTLVVREAS